MSRRSSGASDSEDEDRKASDLLLTPPPNNNNSKKQNPLGEDSEDEGSGSGSGGGSDDSDSSSDDDEEGGSGGGRSSNEEEEDGSDNDTKNNIKRSRKNSSNNSSVSGESRSGEEDSDDSNSGSDDEEGDKGSGGGGSGGGGSSRSGSGSDDDGGDSSGGGSQGSLNSSSSSVEENRRRKQREKEKLWENDPELYGIRRSNRPRYESKPPKLEPQQSHSQSSSSAGGGHKRKSSSSQSSSNKSSHSSSPGKVKRRKVSSDEEESSDEENTRTIRKRGTAVNYKDVESEDEADVLSDADDADSQDNTVNGEMEAEEHVETIERVMESRIGKKGATGSCTTSYAVEEKGDPNLTLPPETETERQFLIKWVGWSHLHNTWESLETLTEMKAKGLKKLDNFCKKEDDHARWKSYASPEDVEYVECQLELQQDLVKLYVNPERIIAERTNDEGIKEYYVKWECLSYAEATWENADLIRKKNPDAIKLFKRREASTKTPSASSKCLKQRPKFSAMKSQPDFLKGDTMDFILRDYQIDGVNWLVHSWCKENSVILADEMGLGKTIQTICFLNYLFESYNLYGPFLLVVPLSTMTAWQKEFAQWAPNINVVTYLGDISSRDVIREYEWFFHGSRKIKFNAILTTYEIVLKDKTFLTTVPWAALMVDEAHRLKNGDSLLYKTLVDFESNHRLLITGTPLQNSLKELWSLLHFIMPGKFDNWEAFEEEHDQAANKGYARLHRQLEPYILRRVKKDVEKSLPAKVEQILRVEMTTVQKQYYKWILTKNYVALRKGVKGSVTSFVNVVMELKKCCNHASLIKPLEGAASDALSTLIKGSGKLMLLDKLLVRLRETGHRVLIFSQMVMMLDIIAEYLQLRRFAFQRLDGSIKGDMRKQALDHFNAEGSTDFCFLLSTRAGGLGINLATADTVIIFDSDWNPQNDLQAQARAHRIGQKNQVMIYRLVTKKSVEEDIVERAKRKMVLDHLVIQRMDTTGRTVLDKGSKTGTPFNKDELNAILKFGAEELFKDEGENEGGDDNCDIDEILRRAETHEEAARPGDDLLSAFKVATFSVNEDDLPEVTSSSGGSRMPGPGDGDTKEWDQIIPEDLRKRVEAEEREKEMADLYLPPRSRTTTAAANDVKPALGNEALNRKARNRKRKRGDNKASEEEEDESESDEDGGGGGKRSKKRGRPKHGKEPKFTEVQVRKFLKSLKKFASPLQRIEKVAEDCGLADKPASELKKLAQELLEGCQQAIADQKANPTLPASVKEEAAVAQLATNEGTDSLAAADGAAAKKRANKPREKGPIFKVYGCSINARTMSIAIDELEALGILIPLDEESRKKWKFDLKVKNAAFDIDWGEDEDTRLLLGVWEYGMGGWDKILENDPVLKSKIFTEGDKKPLVKHAGSRVDYLLRVMKKHVAVQRLKQPKIRKKKEGKKSKANKEGADGASVAVDGAVLPDGASAASGKNSTKKDGKEKKKRGRKKKDDLPKHFAAGAEPTPVSMLGELDPKIFVECKEMMRPVKKALKALDNRAVGPIESKEYQTQYKANLRQIGKQIEVCLEDHKKNEENYRLWKSYLWYFVSKFTEFEAKMLHKNYKKLKKIDEKDSKRVGGEGDGGEKKPKKDKEKREKHHRKDKSDKKAEKRGRGDRTDPEQSQSSFHENSNSSMDGFRRREAPQQYHADNKGYPNKYNRNSYGGGGVHPNHMMRDDQQHPHKYRYAPPPTSDGISNNHYDNRNIGNRMMPGGRPMDPRDRRDDRRIGGHPLPPHDPRGRGVDPRDIKSRGVIGGPSMVRDDNIPSAADPRAAGGRGGRYPPSDDYRGHPSHPPPPPQNYTGYNNPYYNSSSSRW